MIAKYDSGGIFVRQPNDAQRRVIDDLDNNIILFASAGTGKTFTVAKRVAQIIQSGRAKPSELLCLTFTVKACEEMREDIAQYVGQSASDVEIGCGSLIAKHFVFAVSLVGERCVDAFSRTRNGRRRRNAV